MLGSNWNCYDSQVLAIVGRTWIVPSAQFIDEVVDVD